MVERTSFRYVLRPCFLMVFLLLLNVGIGYNAFASQVIPETDLQRDLTAPLTELEGELAPMAYQILKHPNTSYKDSLNRIFVRRMMTILKRADSYNYPFDSLKTVSRITPADQTFRIFTWGITEWDSMRTFRNTYYFGLVQRLYYDAQKNLKPIVIPLIDRYIKTKDIESLVLTHQDWLGALYYKPKNTKYGVLTYTGKVGRVTAMKGKRKLHKVKYYVILGLNEHDIETNYKIIDVITFDPVDTTRLLFGAPIFYYNGFPLSRKVFRYSDNSPFSLNYRDVSTIRTKTFWKKSQKMIVFDHIQMPVGKQNRPTKLFNAGTDGTQNAFYFHKKKFRDERKGFFIFARNVKVYIPETQKYSPKKLKKQARKERKRLRYEMYYQ